MVQDDLNHNIPQAKKVVIIGAGIAGLASAIRLASKGMQVTVLEKNSYPGGKISAFEKDGFKFDAGPSLFTQPQNIQALFELAGEPMLPYLKYRRVPVSCKYFFENGRQVEALADREAFAKNMEESLGEEAELVLQYLAEAEDAYTNIGEFFISNSLHRPKTYFKQELLKAFRKSRVSYFTGSLHEYNVKKFKTPEATQIFDRFATYNGSNPFKAPGILSLIPHLELNQGTFYPEGGMISITQALFSLAQKKGARFIFNSPVSRILQKDGKIQGVEANGLHYYANIVVSNCDVYLTYKHLLGNEKKAKELLSQERSSSAVIFYWGIQKIFPELGLHNIFFSKNYQKEFDCIFTASSIYKDPTVYINITSKLDSIHAPKGCENWFVMINAPTNTGQNWETMIMELRKKVIEKINGRLHTSLESIIVSESILCPTGIEANTGSFMGSIYGTSSNSRFAAFLRHPNFSKTIKGLYFVGGSVHPGGGIPLCLKSAKIMSDLV